MQITVNLKTHAAATVPLWLQGKPIAQWIQLQALLKDMDFTPQFQAGLAADTKGTPGSGFNFYGNPINVDYGSAAVRDTDSMYMMMRGGGAGAWAALDIIGLKLSDDVLKWKTLVNPSPASNLYGSRYQQVPATTAHARMKDGITPNSRHTSYVPNFDTPSNRMYLVGCPLVWETDANPPAPERYSVDSINVDSGPWTGPGAHPNLPHNWAWDAYLVVHDKAGRKFYYFSGTALDVFDVASNTFTLLAAPPGAQQWDRGAGAVDPGRRLLLHIGTFATTPDVATVINVDTGAVSQATLTGAYASAITVGNLFNAGMCFCPDLNCYLFFPDDGFVYTITFTDLTHWAVARWAMTGPAPSPHASNAGQAGIIRIWNRFQYVPALKGCIVVTDKTNPPLFFRTG